MQFRDFLINEDKAYLGEKLGDILNALQDLNDNAKSIGIRQLATNSEGIVNQIRRILHTRWGSREEDHLKSLQKASVAIMKSIEEKDDLEGTLQSAAQEIENLIGRLNTPTNKLATSEKKESPKGKEGENSESEGPKKKPSGSSQGPQEAPQGMEQGQGPQQQPSPIQAPQGPPEFAPPPLG